eukprot:8227661-Lingulodinium_polyedra.AAC.1
MAGVQPINELFTDINFYIHRNSETIKEYIDREELVWNRLRDAIRALDGAGAATEKGTASRAS